MIQDFRNEETRQLFLTGHGKEYGGIARAVLRKLNILESAKALEELKEPPGNGLEKLRGDRAGQYSIRINDQYRLCFRWQGQAAWDVEGCGLPLSEGNGVSIKRKVTDRIASVHPGEMLREEFMVPLGLSSNRLALALQVPATRVLEIVKERRGISADTALRLARYFGMSAEFWMNVQRSYDLATAADAVGDELKQIRPAPRDREGHLLPVETRRSA